MDYYIPGRVNFDRGFGYKYQYLLSTLIIHLIHNYDKLFIKNELDYKLFCEILNDISEKKIKVNLKKTIKDLNSILDYSKVKYNENTLVMLEGHSNYFEDINIFDNTLKKSHIIFLQVKGGDKEGTKTNEEGNFNSTIEKAILSFFQNENLDKINNFTFLVLTNVKNFNKIYFNDSKQNKKSLAGFILEKLIEEEYIKKDTNLDNIKSDLIDNIIKKSEKNDLFVSNNKIHKFLKVEDVKDDLYKKLNRIILIINNFKLMNTLDYRVIIIMLSKFFEGNSFLELLWKVELLSMERQNLEIDNVKEIIKKIDFDEDMIKSLKFIDDNKKQNSKIKYGRIF